MVVFILAGIPAKNGNRTPYGSFLLTMAARRMLSPASPANGPYGRACSPFCHRTPERLETGHAREAELPLSPLSAGRKASRGASRQPEKPFPCSTLRPASRNLSSATDLLLHLQSLAGNSPRPTHCCRNCSNRAHTFPGGFADSVLVLLFLPMLHSILRRVRQRYPALSREDTAQQALGALFASLASARLAERHTYLALAIARRVRARPSSGRPGKPGLRSKRPGPRIPRETNCSESAADSFERAALLRHFFGRAVAAGTLTPGELDLLITFKLEGGAENGAFSNAERQRLKRLLGKLRRLASRNHGI